MQESQLDIALNFERFILFPSQKSEMRLLYMIYFFLPLKLKYPFKLVLEAKGQLQIHKIFY
jgi:hypothetical protein